MKKSDIIFIFYALGLLAGCRSQTLLNASKPIPAKHPQVHGHRGSRGTHPENTQSAFEEAVAAGADWVELDLVLAKNDTPIVSHDPVVSVDFCLGPDKKPLKQLLPFRTLSLTQIKTFDCGSVPNPQFIDQKPVPGQKILSLEEVLKWAKSFPTKKIKLNIETKMTPAPKTSAPAPKDFARVVIGLLKKYQLTDQVVLQSFDFNSLKEAKKIAPSVKLSALFDKTSVKICEEAKIIGAQIASPDFSLVNAPLVKTCHSLGIEVHPWTLNNPADWKKAVSWEVDGIITDYPRSLLTFLNTEYPR